MFPAVLLAGLAAPVHLVQDAERVRPSDVYLDREPQRDVAPFVPRVGPNFFELALQDESYWASYGRRFDGDRGVWTVGLYGEDEDEELAFTTRVLRYADYDDFDQPLSLGVGIAGYVLTADDPDTDAQAIALSGQASTWFDLSYPVTAVLDVSWAPDVSTFGDADRVLDLWARVEVEISENAQVLAGYRHLRVDLEDGGDRDLGESLQLGVRLGW